MLFANDETIIFYLLGFISTRFQDTIMKTAFKSKPEANRRGISQKGHFEYGPIVVQIGYGYICT